ncbi:MAG: phage tail tape measure protein, partial [Flavobacteriales bacterium]|nr:phage tail tape measure protein [Flavobacteriales bacterium]
MADKTIAIKVDLQGTQEQQKKLAKLESEVKKLTLRRTQLNKALKDGTIGLKEYGQKIAQVNTKLKANRREMLVARENILGLDSFTKKLGKSFARLGTNIGGAFVGLFAIQKLGQLVSSAVTTIKDFEQQMANVKAVTGATAIEFQKLEQSAKDLGATTQFTASEVGKLQEEYAKLGFTTDQILDASEATLELATATGSDLAQSAKVAAATINGFGLEAKDTQKIVDVMAKSFTSSALDLNKFETAMSAVAPVAKATGFSLEETTASLGVLVDAGFDASTAGTALRNILLDTTKAGLTTSEAFDMIKGSVDPSSTALDLFGKRGAAVALTLANSTDKTNKFTKALKNSAGSAEAMAKIVGDTLEGDVKKLNSAWEGLILNLGENGEDAFRGIVQGATDLISTLGGLTENIHAGSDAMREQQVAVNTLASRALKLNEGDEDRIKLLNEINVINPDVLKGLDLQTLSNKQLTKATKASNKEMINKIILEKELEKIKEKKDEAVEDAADVVDKEIELDNLLAARKIANKELLAEEDTRYNKLSKVFAKQQLKILEDETLSVNQQVSALFALESQRSRLSDETRKALALTVQIRKANENATESNKELEDAQKKRDAVEKRLNLNQAENNEKKKENGDVTNEGTTAKEKLGDSLEFINQEV